MISQPESPLDIQELPRLIAKHRLLLITGMLLGGALCAIVSFVYPQRYRVHFVLTIYTKYFQSPLVGDFVPSLGESGDAKSQRESLIRQTLTPEYLDSLAEKYGIYPSTSTALAASPIQQLRTRLKNKLVSYGLYQPPSLESRLSAQHQKLLARLEVFSINDTTFNIAFSYSDPQVTFQVAQDLYKQITQGLLDIRMNILVTVRDAIQKKLSSISSLHGQAPTSENPVQEELKSVQAELKAARALYTNAHPMVQELMEREQALQHELKVMPAGSSGILETAMKPPTPETGAAGPHEIADDLTKKLNYLDIAIDSDKQHENDYFAILENPMYPTTPSGPGRAMIILGGLVFGFICAVFIAAIREYFEFTTLRTNVLAQRLGVPLLGELPALPEYVSTSSETKSPKPNGS